MINKEFLNRNTKKWLAVFTAATIVAGSGFAFGVNSANDASSKPAVANEVSQDAEKANEEKTTKDETVYVLCDANGNKNQVIVSDHLKNFLNEGSLSDISNLENIYNTNGDEAFAQDNDKLNWSADGKDIYYRGTTDSALPVDINITYSLDGKEISPKELAGKSGHVTMKISYENKQFETVKINGSDTKIYVPFLVASGMILDNEVFSNVKITNGKLVDDGSHTVAFGVALPGMSENLGLDKIDVSDFEMLDFVSIPDYIEIEADVTNFSLGLTMSVATNELFNKLNTFSLDVDNAEEMIAELTDGITQIVSGSGSLYDGLNTLLEKSNELVKGIDALSDGGNKLAAGAKDLANGANTLHNGTVDLKGGASKVDDGAKALADGANQANAGASQVADGANKLNAGANQVNTGANQVNAGANQVNAGASQANAGSKQLVAGSKQLADGSAELANGLNTLSQNSAALNAGAEQVFNNLLSAAYTQITAAGVTIPQLTVDNYSQVLNGVIQSLNSNPQTAPAAGTIVSLKASLDSYKEFYNGVITYTEGVDAAAVGANGIKVGASSLYTGSKELSTGLDTLAAGTKDLAAGTKNLAAGTKDLANGSKDLANGAKTLNAGTKTLKDGLNTLKNGTGELKNGANKLEAGSKDLANGATTLKNGADDLAAGINTLKSSVPALIEGITALRDGSKSLYDGLNTLYTEAIDGIVGAYKDDLSGLVSRINATIEVSKSYNSFSGISDDMDGSVRFIYRTEGIE